MQLRRLIPALCLLAFTLNAQETSGSGEVSAQGFYAPGGLEPVRATTGLSGKFTYMLKNGTLVIGKAENYASSGLRMTENFLTIRGLPVGGWKMEATAGDFTTPGRVSDFYMPQLYTPLFRLRGARAEAVRGRLSVSAFGGAATFLEGPRLPFAILGPQTMAGGGLSWRQTEKLEFTGQFFALSERKDSIAGRPYLVPQGRRYERSAQATGAAMWKPASTATVYAEGAVTAAKPGDAVTVSPKPWNTVVAGDYTGGRVSAKASWTRQTAGYQPVAGYYTGDRQGGYAEGRFKVTRTTELFASAGDLRNNLEANPELWSFESSNRTAGVAAELPWRWMVSGQISEMRLKSRSPATRQVNEAENRHWMVMASKSYGTQTTRLAWRQFDLRQSGAASLQESAEVEQIVRIGRWTASGAVRLNTSESTERRNSLYVRGMVQGTIKRATVFGYTEVGRDLANQTLYAINQVQSTVVGASLPIGRLWTANAEVIRNILATALNPQSAFLLASQGVPVNLSLGGLDRWNIFFRITRRMDWGGGIPASMQTISLVAMDPVSGAVEGVITETGGAAVAGIPVVLDGFRVERTGEDGRYRFTDVPIGEHSVELSPRELPAEYDTASAAQGSLMVKSARTARRDFTLARLMSLGGQVLGPPESGMENIVIRIDGTRRVTTPEPDGRFWFHNLAEGDYRVVIDETTIQPDRRLMSPPQVELRIRNAQPEPPEALFSLEAVVEKKATRVIQLTNNN